MKQFILTQFPWPWLPTLALVIFFGFFVALLITTGFKSRRPLFQEISQLPLEDGTPHREEEK